MNKSLSFAGLLLALFFSSTTAQATPPVKIGVVLPLTGGAASNGMTIRNSIFMADERYNKDARVEFLFEDDQLLPKNTVSAVRKLLDVDRVEGLIVFGSPTSLAVAPIAEQKKIPLLAFSIVRRVVENKNYVVKHWVTSEHESALIRSEVLRRGYKTVAIVSTVNDAMLQLRNDFIAAPPAKVLLDLELTPDTMDFNAIVARINQVKPDAVYHLLWAPQTGLFAEVLRRNQFKGDIFGVHNIEDPDQVAASKGALIGTWFVTGDDRSATDYYTEYKTLHGSLPSNGGVNAYDAAKLVIEGVASGNLNSYLHNVEDFKGAYGRYGATRKNDFAIPVAAKEVTENGFEFLKPPSSTPFTAIFKN